MSFPSARLGGLAELCLGKMLDKQKNKGTKKPYLRNTNVRWGSFELDDLQEMPFEEHETERYSVRYGDVVVCEGGEPGRCAVWERDQPIYIQKALHRVRCGPELRPRFLAHWLRYAADSGELAKHFTGTTIRHLPGVALAELDVPRPPVQVQDGIVSAIDGYVSLVGATTSAVTVHGFPQAAALQRIDMAIRV